VLPDLCARTRGVDDDDVAWVGAALRLRGERKAVGEMWAAVQWLGTMVRGESVMAAVVPGARDGYHEVVREALDNE
jgi:hypothetical protein